MNIETQNLRTKLLSTEDQVYQEALKADTVTNAGGTVEKLALYHYVGCPFCSIVSGAIDRLGIDVELRDIFENPQFRRDLIDARGRATVPVLRIISEEGEDHWMGESLDIVDQLEARFSR
jgi:glutaredoxin